MTYGSIISFTVKTGASIMGSVGAEKSFLEWRKEWHNKYGVTPDYDIDDGSTMENITTAQRKAIEEELDRFIKVFPEFKNGHVTISIENNLTEDSWAASYEFGYSHVNITDKIFDKKLWKDSGSWYAGVFNTLHPKGTNNMSSISHELAHNIVDRIARKEVKNSADFIQKYNSIVKDTERTITDTAAKSIGSTHGGLVSHISGYANRDRGESIAEAVSDYVANGNNANKYSIAIVKELKKRLK